jgi:hypothetical protein
MSERSHSGSVTPVFRAPRPICVPTQLRSLRHSRQWSPPRSNRDASDRPTSCWPCYEPGKQANNYAECLCQDVAAASALPRLTQHNDTLRITKSVFRLAARRTELCAKAPQLETAPVSEKRVGLSCCPGRPGYGRLIALGCLAVRTIGGVPFGGLVPFGTSTWLLSCQGRLRLTLAPRTGAPTTEAAQASRLRSAGRLCFARFVRSV